MRSDREALRAAVRLWERTDATDLFGCWLWTGPPNPKGYGITTLDGRQQGTHRVAYELLVGPIPDGMQIDHECHTPACVNPAHLRLATPKQNMENRAGPQRNSLTGVRGVDRLPSGRFRVNVGHRGRTVYGGVFGTLAEAETAAIAMRKRLHTHSDPGLRVAAPERNKETPPVLRRGRSGVRWVYFDKRRGSFFVQVGHNNRVHYGGSYATIAEAEAAAIALRERLHAATDRKGVAA